MKSFIRKSRLRPSVSRRGAAAVECAIIAPLLTLLLLGAIDVGQFANVYQKVSDASRHGARVAAKYGTTTTAQVEAAVMDYLEQACPNVAPATLDSATTVTVRKADGSSMSGSLTTVTTGTQIRVQVTMQFEPVRLISGFEGLDGSQITTTTMMRRQ
jgi:Flp pilus assembly protein TadG